MTAKKSTTKKSKKAPTAANEPSLDEELDDGSSEHDEPKASDQDATTEQTAENEPSLDEEGSSGASETLNRVPAGFVTSRPGGGKAEIMRRKLEAQPTVAIMIPLAPGEAPGSTESVILNGYRMNIRKGMYVNVPMQVARVVMESQRLTQEAINNRFLMDETGISPAMREKGIINV